MKDVRFFCGHVLRQCVVMSGERCYALCDNVFWQSMVMSGEER